MTKESLSQLFENNFDCYADTKQPNCDGDVIMAMTKEKFVEVVAEFLDKEKATVETTKQSKVHCMSCEKIVEYSTGVFTCHECSH